MREVGYDEAYADSGKGHKTVYGNIRVIEAIRAIDMVSAAKSELTIKSVLKNLAYGIQQAIGGNDLPALARLTELQGKYLSMWSADGNNAATGLNLNFTTSTNKPNIALKGPESAQDGQEAKTA